MSAGLPGLGLGGLFFIISALVAVPIELARTARGRSSRAAWREVGRSALIAALMVVAIDLSLRAFLAAALLWGAETAPRLDNATVIPLGPASITFALLASLLAATKLLQLALRLSARRRAPQIYVIRVDASGDAAAACSAAGRMHATRARRLESDRA